MWYDDPINLGFTDKVNEKYRKELEYIIGSEIIDFKNSVDCVTCIKIKTKDGRIFEVRSDIDHYLDFDEIEEVM